ncbi:MAG: N-acetyltransferase [Hyphomicrobiaceae bacterium]
MSPYVIAFRPVTAADLPAIQDLQDQCFGPGRFARAAYRVREGVPLFSRHCRCASIGEEVVASLRMTPITIGGKGEALMLGPLAVTPRLAGQGIGRRLVAEALEHAEADGIRLVLLVGDLPYYGRFGFTPVPEGQIVMPGPVNPARLLALEVTEGTLAAYRGEVKGVR